MYGITSRIRDVTRTDEAETEVSFMEEQRKAGQDGVKILQTRLMNLQKIVDNRRKVCMAQPANAKEVFCGSNEKQFKESEFLEIDFQEKLAQRKKELLRDKLSRTQTKSASDVNLARMTRNRENIIDRISKNLDKHVKGATTGKKGHPRGGSKSQTNVGMTKSRSIASIITQKRMERQHRKRPKYLQRSASYTVIFNNQKDGQETSLGSTNNRRVQDVIYYNDERDSETGIIELETRAALKDVLRKIKIRRNQMSYFQVNTLSKTSQEICSKLFWFSFCKYFQRNSEDVQDSLIAEMSKLYTLFLRQLTLHELEINVSLKDKFFRFFPFIMSEAIAMLLRHVFPGSVSIMDHRLRSRLDIDFTLLISGVHLTPITHTSERAYIFKNHEHKHNKDDEQDYLNPSGSDDDYDVLDENKTKKNEKKHATTEFKCIDDIITPLEEDYIQMEKDDYRRSLYKRVRPRKVRFNTTLMTPIMQRGLQRHAALPFWDKGKYVEHAMPWGDSIFGGEDTFVPYTNNKITQYNEKLSKECANVRSKVRSLTHDSIIQARPKLITLEKVLALEDQRQKK